MKTKRNKNNLCKIINDYKPLIIIVFMFILTAVLSFVCVAMIEEISTLTEADTEVDNSNFCPCSGCKTCEYEKEVDRWGRLSDVEDAINKCLN